MVIGVPKEIKSSEMRVALSEAHIQALVSCGHAALIEKGAGRLSGVSDEQYARAGGEIADSASDLFERSDMIVKVKEPLPEEYRLFREGQILFTFLHLAAEPELTELLLRKKVSAIAYETIETAEGRLPLLEPMSQAAGRLALQNGVLFLQSAMHGKSKGILPGGLPGVPKASAVIVGAGAAGLSAGDSALGLRARVTFLDIDLKKLLRADQIFNGRAQTLFSDEKNLKEALRGADIVIGAPLLAGHKAPKLITEEMIQSMEEGSVLIDIAIDQGGCIEGARPTSHKNPTYMERGAIYYCVPNIPSLASRSSSKALANASLPFILAVAEKGLEKALLEGRALQKGLSAFNGALTSSAVAEALGKEFVPFEKALRRRAL